MGTKSRRQFDSRCITLLFSLSSLCHDKNTNKWAQSQGGSLTQDVLHCCFSLPLSVRTGGGGELLLLIGVGDLTSSTFHISSFPLSIDLLAFIMLLLPLFSPFCTLPRYSPQVPSTCFHTAQAGVTIHNFKWRKVGRVLKIFSWEQH